MSQGKYIARMDSDDISYYNRIEEQVKFMEENQDVGVCACQAKFFGDLIIPQATSPPKVDFISMLKKWCLVHPAMMFRKDLNITYPHLKPYEDVLLIHTLLAKGVIIKNLDKPLFSNRINKDSLMEKNKLWSKLSQNKIIIFAICINSGLNLSFADTIFTKNTFKSEEIIEFLKFSKEANELYVNNDIRLYNLLKPFFKYMIFKCSDKKSLFFKIFLNGGLYKYLPIHKYIYQTLFSIKNYVIENKRIKYLTILGIRIKLKEIAQAGSLK